MKPQTQTDSPDASEPLAARLSAVNGQGRPPTGSAPTLRAEAPRIPALLRRLDRLRRLLCERDEAIAQLRGELARASQSSQFDLLTGLPNRRGVEQPMGRMLAQHAGGPHKLALLFVDLDGFKTINDRLGHAAGDALLQIVSARLAAGMRSGDLVCRHGGDEFVCLLPNLDSEDRARALAAGLRHAITQPCALHGHQVAVDASIGVAIYPRDGHDLAALLRSADSAMYAAKRGRCGVAMAWPDALPG